MYLVLRLVFNYSRVSKYVVNIVIIMINYFCVLIVFPFVFSC